MSAHTLIERLENDLARLQSESRFRSLNPHRGIDFTSNDYLGFANRPELRERALAAMTSGLPLSASGSRLLRGNHPEHEKLERCFAEFVGAESAIYFNSGYEANFALLTTLPTRHDTILIDELVHASIHEGAHASLATRRTFSHNSVQALSKTSVDGDVYVVVDGVYSMDGDEAPITEIAALCNERGWTLIVDEAHSSGVFGPHGEGLVSEFNVRTPNVISMHTCGKAFGAAGAIIACNRTIKNYLINKARPFIFSTALPPLMPFQVCAAIDLLRTDATILPALRNNITHVRQALRKLKRWEVIEGRSPVVAVIIGSNEETLAAAKYLQDSGIDARAIRPPSVPRGTSRLRISIHAEHSPQELELLCAKLLEAEDACAA